MNGFNGLFIPKLFVTSFVNNYFNRQGIKFSDV